jgi:hypothetical protein
VATVAQRVEFAVDTTPPRLRLLSRSLPQFSIDEPATITAVFDDSRTVVRRRLVPGRFTIPSGGPFSRFRVTARDFAGNETRPLQYR